MNERRIEQLICETLLSGFASIPLPIRAQRSYQPSNHAAPSTPTIVFHRIATTPAHWVYRKVSTDGFRDTVEHHANKLVTYQMNALVVEPEEETIDDMTASDYLDKARMMFQSADFLGKCKTLGINVLHITTMADVPVQNESDEWEYQPSFDVTFAIKDVLTQSAKRADAVRLKIHSV